MKASDQWKQIQAACGLTGDDLDGVPGSQTDAAIASVRAAAVEEYKSGQQPIAVNGGQRVIHGGPDWKFFVSVDGDDLLLTNVRATCFGGSGDRMDGGGTASGYSTRGHPNLVALSLPMEDHNLYDHEHGYVLRDSPIPRMPFGLTADGFDKPDGCHCDIEFIESGVKVQNVQVIELGPADWTGNAADCTIALARKANPNATANDFEARVNVRIKNAAKYLKA